MLKRFNLLMEILKQTSNGKLYLPADPAVAQLRLNAQMKFHELNRLSPDRSEEKNRILRELLGSYGDKISIDLPFYCDYGVNIHLGENFYSNYNLVILDCAEVHIGNNVMFGPNVSVYTAGHPIGHKSRLTGKEYALPVSIGDNVWVGGNAVILPGVTIGENSVIGAGSIVVKSIPSGVIAAGNPCKVIREVTEEDEKTTQFHAKK